MKVVSMGTGYVGLTTGVAFAYLGHQVVCFDVDRAKIDSLNHGKLPIYEPHLDELFNLATSNLKFTDKEEDIGLDFADVIFISVGTPSMPDGRADMQYVQMAAEMIGRNLGDHFTVVVNKSTVPIGSGNWVSSLIRDAYLKQHGQKPDGRFAMASNPEFLRQGSALFDTLYPDRVVIGGEDTNALDMMTNLYRPILNQEFAAPDFLQRPEHLGGVPLLTCDLASAELIKYAANAFLALKISYINEIGMLATKVGADITQVARGIGLDSRIGPRFLQAGIGWGGSCFGKDTAALVATASEYGLKMPIVESAREVNYQMRIWVVDQLLNELKILKGRKVALFGVAFKPNTDDLRDAPSIDIARNLIQRGAKVSAHDPVALENARRLYSGLGIIFTDDPYQAVADADAAILVTEWPDYRKISWSQIKSLMKGRLVLDGRNFLSRPEMEALGFAILNVGK